MNLRALGDLQDEKKASERPESQAIPEGDGAVPRVRSFFPESLYTNPALITDGRLESRAGLALSSENSHVMLCGNPAMVDDVQAVLATRGMKRHRRREPGHITLETYW